MIRKTNLPMTGYTCIIGGVLLILMSIFAFDSLVNLVCVIVGIMMIINNIYYLFILSLFMKTNATGFILNVEDSKIKIYTNISLCMSIAGIIFGTIFIFNHDFALSLAFGIYMVIYPLIRIYFALDRKVQVRKEIPIFASALVILILAVFGSLGMVLKALLIGLGVFIILLGIYLIVVYYKGNDNNKNSNLNSDKKSTIEVDAEEVK